MPSKSRSFSMHEKKLRFDMSRNTTHPAEIVTPTFSAIPAASTKQRASWPPTFSQPQYDVKERCTTNAFWQGYSNNPPTMYPRYVKLPATDDYHSSYHLRFPNSLPEYSPTWLTKQQIHVMLSFGLINFHRSYLLLQLFSISLVFFHSSVSLPLSGFFR